MFTMTLLLIYYLNFKLGFSQDPPHNRARGSRPRLLLPLELLGVGRVGGIGLTYIWESIAALIGTEEQKKEGSR
jgi:hypothetical protein